MFTDLVLTLHPSDPSSRTTGHGRSPRNVNNSNSNCSSGTLLGRRQQSLPLLSVFFWAEITKIRFLTLT